MLHYWDTSDNWVALQFVVALYTVTATQIDIIPLLVHYVIFLIGKWIQISNEDSLAADWLKKTKKYFRFLHLQKCLLKMSMFIDG